MVTAETVTLSVGTVGMVLGVVIWYRLWAATDTTSRERGAFAWLAVVPAAAAVAYGLMTLGVGYISVGNTVVPVPRYVDWLVTTPVLIGYVAHTAGATRRTVGWIVAVDLAMIAVGWAGVVTSGTVRAAAFAVSSLCYVGLLYALYGVLPDVAADRSGPRRRLFEALQNHVGLLWVTYPVVWAAGPLGFGYVETVGVTLLITFVDVMAKTPYVYFVSLHRSAFLAAADTAGGGSTTGSTGSPTAADGGETTAD
ncbi:MAG: bacteriorhodopsin [halophilic archaeon J07HB67]|jgi:Bacteriorhodopsin|nr:MAG: bacteriorhodopsin [halophilic archaeon J07HB67]